MKTDLRQLVQTWKELGEQDPLWAVATHPDKRHGGWDLAEFMDTGERSIAYYSELIARHAPKLGTPAHVLDFGCGVGRLTSALSKRASKVTGVDISAPMLRQAELNLAELKNVSFVLNQSDDLRVFKDGTFDLVFSLICLQHMPWTVAAGYIGEFARVCRPGGIVAFQVPSREAHFNWTVRFRKACVESLPFGLGRRYRRWRHGSSALFEMNFTPRSVVEAAASAARLRLVHCEPDASAGPNTEGYFYIFETLEQ